MEEGLFWCHACSRLQGTRAGEACPICLAPDASSLERIVDVLNSSAFVHSCNPAGPPASAEPPPLVTVCDAGMTCPICLDELEPGASAAEMQCQHVYHPACLAPWLEKKGTCPVCRGKSMNEADAAGSPDGLILGDMRGADHFALGLGRRTAGLVRMVGMLDKGGELVGHRRPRGYRLRRLLPVRLFGPVHRHRQVRA
ncbi:hypothetical protein QYE76_056322 [Lolium multiflorum]|uniref:RING-type domain-containing protein n=1 Tax=Lolium multiflorum TaxID=4521 RepID=A0AAD8T341_LOLMU|nr:hypothetical protein QYE76_056322 [Lolium multiflorum]